MQSFPKVRYKLTRIGDDFLPNKIWKNVKLKIRSFMFLIVLTIIQHYL